MCLQKDDGSNGSSRQSSGGSSAVGTDSPANSVRKAGAVDSSGKQDTGALQVTRKVLKIFADTLFAAISVVLQVREALPARRALCNL